MKHYLDISISAFAAAILLFLLLMELASAAPIVPQRMPRGWRYERPVQSTIVRGSISIPNRPPRGR